MSWLKAAVGSDPRSELLLRQRLHVTLGMPLSLSNVAPQSLVPGPLHRCHLGWEAVGSAPACTHWVASAVDKVPQGFLCSLK